MFKLEKLKPGDNLPNGATVVAVGLTGPTQAVVLAYTERNYITWRVSEDGSAHLGYYQDKTPAGFLTCADEFDQRTRYAFSAKPLKESKEG